MNIENLRKYINIKNGVFLEAGANDGVFHSYTYLLEVEDGWTGVLIEPSINVLEMCKQNRPNNIHINSALVSNSSILEIVGDFDDDVMSSVGGKRLNRTDLLYTVPATTLTKIFDIYFHDKKVDLISIDVENYEYEALSGLDYNKHRPTFILAEIYTESFSKVYDLLIANNYCYIDNITNYNHNEYPNWDGKHNDYLFKDNQI